MPLLPISETMAREEVAKMRYFVEFLVSVMASIAAYYICKWLDRDEDGNQPEE